MSFHENDLKEVSMFVAKDFHSHVDPSKFGHRFPQGGKWFSTYQANVLIVALLSPEDARGAKELHGRFGTPFPGLIAPDFGDKVAINAYDGTYFYKDNKFKNVYALNVLAGASVILENHEQSIEIRDNQGRFELVNYKIPLAFVIGITGHTEFDSVKAGFKKAVGAYFKAMGAKG